MDNRVLSRLNGFINKAYECSSFSDFLKLTISKLHDFVPYDSGMFFCQISKDCSFFKPYTGGDIEDCYNKYNIEKKGDDYYESSANEAFVYKSTDYKHGTVIVDSEPRKAFIGSQDSFNIVCIRIVYKGRFLGEVYLHRGKDKPDFDDEDMFILRLMQPHISTVFNIIHTLTAVRHVESGNDMSQGLGICVFDEDMSLKGGNILGFDMLKVTTIFSSSILYHIKEICADMRDNSILSDQTVIKTSNADIKVTIYQGFKEQKFIVIMNYENKDSFADEYKFKFTKREADIIDALIQGKNNLQLAESFQISENTVKTHIKSIYKKAGVNNRTELTYILMLNNNVKES